jgi:hypothetical protein
VQADQENATDKQLVDKPTFQPELVLGGTMSAPFMIFCVLVLAFCFEAALMIFGLSSGSMFAYVTAVTLIILTIVVALAIILGEC